MNFLKKKLKPLTTGLTSSNSHQTNQNQKDLEDDLYDEYVVEAPPHPSELLALGVEPSEIDVNDPDKLRELYKRAKEEGKDKKTNSILLARQRQKEEIEEKKRTREEWKFFDSLTSRVEQVVKESQKTLEHLKESSAIEKLAEPDYELRLTPDQVFKSSTTVKQEKGENNWVDFGDEDNDSSRKNKSQDQKETKKEGGLLEEFDEFGCPKHELSNDPALAYSQNHVVEELLEDFGIDLRTAEQKRRLEKKQKEQQLQQIGAQETNNKTQESPKKLDIDIKAAARPRPRPGAAQATETTGTESKPEEKEVDPFDTSFVASVDNTLLLDSADNKQDVASGTEQPKVLDPFDTSYINL